MKKKLTKINRKNFLHASKTKNNCQMYLQDVLEKDGLNNISEEEFSKQLKTLTSESEEIFNLIKEQETFLEKKSHLFLLPKFFFRNLAVKKKTEDMEKTFTTFVKEKSQYSPNENITNTENS